MSNGILRAALSILLVAAAPAAAEPPRVVVDVAPVHSIVASLMDGVGEPVLLVAPGTSPHDFALRPSQARALQEADLVVWVGPGLTPLSLEEIGGIVRDAALLDLLAEAEGGLRLTFRDSHAHRDGETEVEDAHGHGGHQDGDGHDHGVGALDPHAWLDPETVRAWLPVLAAALTAADPDNAEAYRANADAADAALAALTSEIALAFAGREPPRYLVAHDAYQYFETRFDLPALGAITLADDAAPSAGRLSELRAEVEASDPACIVVEWEVNTRLAEAVAPGVPLLEADPTGAGLEPGPGLYPALLRRLASALQRCG